MASNVNEAGIFTSSNSLPLMADLQYMEPYASSALNRKMLGIILPGVFRGFNVKPGTGLNVVISSTADGTGAACIEVNGYQITVQQLADVTVAIPKGQTTIVLLEANYGNGTLTKQVSSGAALDAARFVAVKQGTAIKSNQIEICRVTLSASATAITQANINMETRTRRRVGPIISDAIDSTEQYQVASSNAVKLAVDKALLEMSKRILRGEKGMGASGLTVDQAFDWQTHKFVGGEYVYFSWSQAKNNPLLGYPDGYYQIMVTGLSTDNFPTLLIRPVDYQKPLAPFLVSWTMDTADPTKRVFRYRAIKTALHDLSVIANVTPNTLNALCYVGEYAQPVVAKAIVADGYPLAEAGVIKVSPGINGVVQEYIGSTSGRRFVRGMPTKTTFANWVETARATDLSSRFNAVGHGNNEVTLVNNFDWQQFDIKSGGIMRAVTTNWKNAPDGLDYSNNNTIAIECYMYMGGANAAGTVVGLRLTATTSNKAQIIQYNVTMTGVKGSRKFFVQRILSESDMTTTPSDSTAGRLLKVGDFGVGGDGLAIADASITTAGGAKSVLDYMKSKGMKSGFYRLNGVTADGFYQDSPFIYARSGATQFSLAVNYTTGVVKVVAGSDSMLVANTLKVNTLYGSLNKPTNNDLNLVSRAGDIMTGQLKMQVGGNALRFYSNNGTTDYGAIIRRADTSLYFLATDMGAAKDGDLNSLRPLKIGLDTGLVTIGNGLTVSGNATFNSALFVKTHLDIGDADSGLIAKADGSFSFRSNSAEVGYFNKDGLYVKGQLNIGDTDSGLLANGDGSVAFRGNSTTIGNWSGSGFNLGVPLQVNSSLTAQSIELQGGFSLIDFHRQEKTEDYNIRLYNDGDNKLTLSGSGVPLFNNAGGTYIGRSQGTGWGSEFGNDFIAPFNSALYTHQAGDAWCPLIKGEGQKARLGYRTSVCFGYYLPSTQNFNLPIISARYDNGQINWWTFNPDSGDISYSRSIPNQPGFSRGVAMQDWVNDLRGQTHTWVSQNFATQTGVAQGYVTEVGFTNPGSNIPGITIAQDANVFVPDGAVIIGYHAEHDSPMNDTLFYRYLQYYRDGGWRTAGVH